ncbi:MAG: hypothetical protein GY788_11265 [bacterium]|nr:hypothetical protein [bacterium]
MDTKDDDCVACDDVDVYPTWDCSGTGTYTYRTATYSYVEWWHGSHGDENTWSANSRFTC